MLGLAGLAGSGASEVLGAVFGRLPRAGGRVQVDGRDVPAGRPAAALRQGLAFLDERPQGGGPDAPPLGRRERDAREPAPLLARRLAPPAAGGAGRSRPGATSSTCRRRRSARPSRPLSGGNQQKALLARLWLTEPAVLLLDEPTRGVDVTAKARIHRLIDEWSRAGRAVVLTSSELPELLALSDRVLVLHRGEVARRAREARGQRREGDRRGARGSGLMKGRARCPRRCGRSSPSPSSSRWASSSTPTAPSTAGTRTTRCSARPPCTGSWPAA